MDEEARNVLNGVVLFDPFYGSFKKILKLI